MFLQAGSLRAQTAPPAAAPSGPPPITVLAAAATIGPVPLEVLANGIVQATAIVSVRARVDGQIDEVHVQEGQSVRRGQPLFTLDSRTNRALLAQQRANLDKDRAQLTRARSDAARYAALRSDAFASAQRAEQAAADALALEAQVRADEAQIQQTQLAIDFAEIRAEADGRLGALPFKAGNLVRFAEGAVLATITPTDPILVAFNVPERWLSELRTAFTAGQVVRARVRAPEDRTGPPVWGDVVFVDSSVDQQTGTILLKARFTNTENRLWPGQYVETVLVPRTDAEALSVPTPAVQMGQEGRYLFALRDGVARRIPVRLVRQAGDRSVIVAEGLGNGDMVVTEGAQRLRDGSRATVRGTPPAGPRPAADATSPDASMQQAAAR
ncbi:efflux RND transporter periplasmic adaptor subunit [Humitalea sp. 24SJ18S-53]|uniref:efflux RND transporter periplasmic adaptor subunit n=1 Tax=Humitalea sp. 24SJ18S-53 TaxID=3422307 RepID=UPI003D672D94